MEEILYGLAGVIIKILGFDEDFIVDFAPFGTEFGFLPSYIMNLGIKIEHQKAKVVAREIIFGSRVAKPDDELH